MRVLLAGLWTRRGMNAATLLVTVVAVVAAVLGPMYGRATTEHLLDSRIDERAPYTTGLFATVPAQDGDHVPRGDPANFVAPPVGRLLTQAEQPLQDPAVRRFWSPATSWARDPGGTFRYGPRDWAVGLYWRDGMCTMAQVRGRCPSRRGEALVQATMAGVLGLSAGDRFEVTYTDAYRVRTRTSPDGTEAQRPRTETFRVVGTYRIADPEAPRWFDLSRFTGNADLRASKQRGSGGQPTAPALLVSPESMVSQTFEAGVDRPIDTGAVDLDTMGRAERAATTFKSEVIDQAQGNETEILPDLDLGSVVDQVRTERASLSRVLVAALAPLLVLALLLIFALASTGAQVRRPHVALAKLRGQTRGQVLWFALSEPFLVVFLAVPIGLGLAVATMQLVARGWLHPGIPVRLDVWTLLGLVVVVGSALAASAAAALTVVREPLATALAGAVRPRPASRFALVLRSAVVAVALAAVANLLASGDQSSQLLALLTPTLVALAVAVAGGLLLRLLCRRWTRRTSGSGGTAGYLASRRLARRQDLADLMVPLLLAVAVLTFASSASATSDDWRVSRARAEIGAAHVYVASSTPGRLLQVTREVDPEGRYVAAAAIDNAGDDLSRGVFVDTSRLDRVAAWDPSWSDRGVASLQRSLTADRGRRLSFHGRELSVVVDDVSLRSRTGERSVLQLQYVDDRGEQRDVLVGNLRNGAHQTLSVPVEGCARRCLVEQLYVTGTSASVSDAQGRLTLARVSLDGREVDWGLTDPSAWRPARPFPVSLVDPPEVITADRGGLHLRVYLGQLPPGEGPQNAQVSGFARITPSSTPDTVPALVAEGTATTSAEQAGSGIALTYPRSTVVGTSLNGQSVPMRVVARTAALPVVGTEGSLSDLETALVEFEPPPGAFVRTELWVADGTPGSVLAAIRRSGISLTDPQHLDTTLHDLRTDAFSLGLRLFLLVGAATLVLAVFGVFVSAVLQSRWRSYEVAALRVVGVSQRTLVRGSVLEYVALLGVAVVLGVLSAYLSLRLVLPSVSLGTADDHDPAPVYATHWPVVAAAAAVLFALAVLIAVVVSRRVTRLGRPSTLRWAEQA